MSASSTVSLITDNLADFGAGVLTIITATLAIGVAYLLFRFGWRKVKGSLR